MDITYDVLYNLVQKGLDNYEIAAELGISAKSVPNTLKFHGINRNKIFNANREINSNYWDNFDKVNATEQDSEFFSIYGSSDIDDILYK